MKEGRWLHGLIKLDSLIYVFGGVKVKTAEKYNLCNDTWTKIRK